MTMEAWEIIQYCELAPKSGLYNKEKLLAALQLLPPEEISHFCRQFLHLMEFYSSNVGAYVTDYPPLVQANPDLYWQLTPINFDLPAKFRRIK